MKLVTTTAIVLSLVAGAACAQTAPVDEYHHAIAPVKGVTVKKPLALRNDVIYARKPRQTAPVYMLENRPRTGAIDTGNAAFYDKHNANNW